MTKDKKEKLNNKVVECNTALCWVSNNIKYISQNIHINNTRCTLRLSMEKRKFKKDKQKHSYYVQYHVYETTFLENFHIKLTRDHKYSVFQLIRTTKQLIS